MGFKAGGLMESLLKYLLDTLDTPGSTLQTCADRKLSV